MKIEQSSYTSPFCLQEQKNTLLSLLKTKEATSSIDQIINNREINVQLKSSFKGRVHQRNIDNKKRHHSQKLKTN